jgi:hypothetical protein
MLEHKLKKFYRFLLDQHIIMRTPSGPKARAFSLLVKVWKKEHNTENSTFMKQITIFLLRILALVYYELKPLMQLGFSVVIMLLVMVMSMNGNIPWLPVLLGIGLMLLGDAIEILFDYLDI